MDVIDLRNFYGRPMGRVARALIGRRIRMLWPDVRGLSVLGLGFATPYLGMFLGEAERVLGLMPAQQGVLRWPAEGRCLTGLADEKELPLDDECIDRVIVIHGVEASESLRANLRQIWRVLAPGGKVLIVVPNRRGLWARREATPFGYGQPFSRSQITQALRESLFSPAGWDMALFVPPFEWRPLMRAANAWERVGGFLWPRFSGVILVEATKQIYAATPIPDGRRGLVRQRVRAVLPVQGSVASPSVSTGDDEGAA